MSTKLAYTLKEAAAATGLSVDRVKRAIYCGDLRAKRSGKTKDGDPAGRYLVLHADLQSWLDGMEEA